MSIKSPEFRTRKGHRVYLRSRQANGQTIYADNYTLRVKQDGETSYFNLGTKKNDAGAKADEIMAFLAVEGNTVKEALARYSEKHKNKAIRLAKAPKPVEAVLTVGATLERYLEVTTQLSAATRHNNVNALRHIAAGIMGLPKLGKDQTKKQQAEWRAKVDPFPVADFTTQNVEEFRQRELRETSGNFLKNGSTRTTLNSYIRSARSVFTRKLLPLYSALNLPDPLPFRDIMALPEPPHRYTSKIDVAVLIQDAKATLHGINSDAWIAFLLFIGAGLRRAEMDKLMLEQIDLKQGRIEIRTTEFFRPKAKNSEDSIDLSPAVTEYLREYIAAMPERVFLLPSGGGGKIRCAPTFRALMRWLKDRGVTERTPLHTLRKEAGSMVFQKGGSIDLAASFLRNDPRVAREHYIGKKERLELVLPGL